MMKIPVTKPVFDQQELINIKQTLESGWVAQGPQVALFEQKVAEHEKVKYAVATTSCTTALHLVMVALGIAKGQDVMVPAFTFVATVNAVQYTGATPVLVDIDFDTYNISVSHIREIIAAQYVWDGIKLRHHKTGNDLNCICVVHLFGLCADMDEIMSLAEEYHLKVIEDSACAMGARIGDRIEGTFGVASCLSFHPRKCITTGEGGMVLTNDQELFHKMKELRSHGARISETARDSAKGYLLPPIHEIGYNYRMSDIQGAIGCAQMDKLDEILESRRSKAYFYDENITYEWLVKPDVPRGYYHTYQSYVCRLNLGNEKSVEAMHDVRNRIMELLEERGVQTRQGTHAVHMLLVYQQRYNLKKEDYWNSYQADALSIALPLYADMTEAEQQYVISCLGQCYEAVIKGE